MEEDGQFNPDFVFEEFGFDTFVREEKKAPSDNVLDGIIRKKRQQVDISDDEESEEEDLDHEDSEEDHEEMEQEDTEVSEEDEEEKERKSAFFDNSIEASEEESFASMNLSRPIMKGLNAMNFSKPTKIQSTAIPIALQGKDICGAAVTGSGKTAAFIVPILERLLFRSRQSQVCRVLILLPTRELAVQCFEVAKKLASFTDIHIAVAAGGLPLKEQEMELKRRPDIVIATPGRLIDHLRNSVSFSLDSIEILVLDEADRMLDVGFSDELNEIINFCPKGRQTMLFSATMTDNVDELIKLSLNKPVRLFVDNTNATASKLTQEFVKVKRDADRIAMIVSLCRRTFKQRCILFLPSKNLAHEMKVIFGLLGMEASELHGNLTQQQRLEALELFRDGRSNFLLATDLAARGLDISNVETVINYGMPTDYRQYLHRIGRTARAGKSGRSITLIGESDRKVLKMALKHSAIQPKQRIIPSASIAEMKEKIESLKKDIKDILEEEKQEKFLRRAEMEASKAENIIKYEKEIYAKPARTWFQSKKQKLETKKRATGK